MMGRVGRPPRLGDPPEAGCYSPPVRSRQRLAPTVPAGWRCSECGGTAKEAAQRRKELGLTKLFVTAKVCTPRCGRARETRRWRERYGPGGTHRFPGLDGWRCAWCGCSAEAARRKRRKAGRAPLQSGHVYCGRECQRAGRQAQEASRG